MTSRRLPSERDVSVLLGGEPDSVEAAHLRVETILERALNYRQCVVVLHDSLGLPDEVIASVAGVHTGTVRRWRSSDPDVGEPRAAQEEAIERLRRIVLVLVQSRTFLDLRGIGVWLRAGARAFEWRAPYEVMPSENGYELVLEEAQRFVMPGAGILPAGFGPPRPRLSSDSARARPSPDA